MSLCKHRKSRQAWFRNLYKYTKIYAGGAPVLFEDDVFKIEISLEKSIEAESDDKINESADKPPITADKPLIKR